MTAQRVAGWVAVVSGILLVLGIAASAIGQAAGDASAFPNEFWQRGPGMGQAPMGPGMMGFGNASPAASAIPGATEVRVVALNFSFTPSEIRVPHATEVNLTLSNPAANGVVHDLTVPALGIHIVANPGETKTVGLRGLPAGRYDAFCSVPGHTDLGMRATVLVE
jgi:heme/copper-type cytochrome/quinol oxidase subunit 2